MALSVDEINKILRGNGTQAALSKASAETNQLNAQNAQMNRSMQQAAYGQAYNPATENYLGTEKIPLLGGILPSLYKRVREVAQGASNAFGGTNPYQFISPEESANIRGNNTGEADWGKTGRYMAGTALEFAPMIAGIPALKGATQAVAGGATMGLGGALQDTSNQDLGSILGQTALGGVLGGGLYGAGKLAGKAAEKLKTPKVAEAVEATGDVKTIAPKEGLITRVKNWFQEQNAKSGGLQQTEQLGGESLSKEQTKLLFKHIDQLETANKGFAPNFESLVDSADILRDNGVRELKTKGIGQANSLSEIDKLAQEVQKASDYKINASKAKQLVDNKITSIFESKPDTAAKTVTPKGTNWQMDAGSWHELAGDTQGGYMKYNTKTGLGQSPMTDEVVDYVINKSAKDILKQSPSYKEGNDLFGALYNSLPKRTVLANAGNDLRLTYQGSIAPGMGLLNKIEQKTSAAGLNLAKKLEGKIPATGTPKAPFAETKVGQGAIKGLDFLSKPSVAKVATYGGTRQLTAKKEMPVTSISSTSGASAPSMVTENPSESDFMSKLPFFTSLGMTPKEAYLQYYKENQTKTAKTTKDMASAQSGMSALSKMQSLLQSDSGLLAQANIIPGFMQSPTAKQFVRAGTEIRDVLARLRTGATINKDEEALYQSYIPNMWDDQDTISYKMNMLNDLFSTIGSNQSTQGTQTQSTQTSDLSLLQ